MGYHFPLQLLFFYECFEEEVKAVLVLSFQAGKEQMSALNSSLKRMIKEKRRDLKMDAIRKDLHEVLSVEKLDEIIALTNEVMEQNHKAISERAVGMADEKTYQRLLDYCYEQTALYIDNRDNMMKLLTDSKNIQPVYNSIVGTEEFEQVCPKEYKGFPRVIAMTVLAGSEAAAANAALSVLQDAPEALVLHLDQLIDIYQSYLRDAIAYGKGENKSVVMTGSKQ